jgi:O-antigen/teichoic acid export membrane protein
MSNTRTTIVKNAGVLVATQVVTWVLTLFLTIFLPRYLGPEAMGSLGISWAIWAIVTVLAKFGMNVLLFKEVARDNDRAPELLGASLVLRVLFFIGGYGLVLTYLQFVDYSPLTVSVVMVMGFYHLSILLYEGYQFSLQGLEKMQYISLASIGGKVVNTVAGIAVLLLGFGIYAITGVYIVSGVVTLLLMGYFLHRFYRPQLTLSPVRLWSTVKASLPYLFSGFALVLYTEVDVVVISLLVDEQTVGWYGAADRLFGTTLFLPVAIMASLFPTLTRTHKQAPEELPPMFRRAFDIMLLFAVPIGLGMIVIAEPLVALLYGPAFAPTAPVLAVNGVVIIFTYLTILIGQYLVSTDRQRIWGTVILLMTALTIPLDLVLIPWTVEHYNNGAIGGALSFVVTELIMLTIGFQMLPRGALGWSTLRSSLLIGMAGLGMAVVAWYFRPYFIAIPVIAGAITYVSLVLLLRVIPREDLDLIVRMGRQAVGKVRRKVSRSASAIGD